jgi:hypothetical protein
MKRVILFLFLFLASISIWIGESRKFFCLNDDYCITVWKTYNNVCFVIPGKYYGLVKPSTGYLQTSNSNTMTLYFSNELPNSLVFKSDQNLKVFSNEIDGYIFFDYSLNSEKFDSLLYITNPKKNSDIKDNVSLIDLFIPENYAIDKRGKKL